MINELTTGLLIDGIKFGFTRFKTEKYWKKIFVDTGKFFCEYEKNADQIFDDMAKALSYENMNKLAEEIKSENGYELKEKLYNYLLRLLRKYEIPEDIARLYTTEITQTIIAEISNIAPEKYDRYYLNEWKDEEERYLEQLSKKVEQINNSLTEFNEHQIKVYSANILDIELKRKTINPKIGIDFFEIDDDNFKQKFKERLQDNKICVRGRFVEETIFCILNELWNIRDSRAVFVVQSEDDWGHLRTIAQEGNIYIPNFIADEIVPIEKNTNIFVYTEDIPAFSNNIIELRPRTYSTLTNCLARAGMDVGAASDLVEETHGLYVAMRKKIFNGQILKQPQWVSNLDNKVKKTCLLLGQWTECDGDVAVVETLSGISYSEFIDKLAPYTKGDDPLIHVVNRRGKKSYYLASVENTWEYFQVSVLEDFWKSFVKVFLDVFNEHEKLFTYNNRDFLKAKFSGEEMFWSPCIRFGMLKTLLIKAGYKGHEDCQEHLDKIVMDVLSYVDNSEKWKYISEFFTELCEIAPRIVLNRLFKEFEKFTGLLELFEHQNTDYIMEKNQYISILFGVETFLLQTEYAIDAYTWLLRLDDLGLEYKSNSPKGTLEKVLCTWHDFSVFRNPTEKIRLAEMAFENDKNAWQLVYGNLPDSYYSAIGTLCEPKYRKCVQNGSATLAASNRIALGYIDLLIQHVNYKSERWIELLKYSENVNEAIRKKIMDSFLVESIQMDDSGKIEVKNSIRELIYRHRYYNSATWALDENVVLEYEYLLNQIHSEIPEYEFVYLFKPSYESPLLHPMPYEKENRRDSNENAVVQLLKKSISDFKEKKYSLSLLANLCANMDNSTLGSALARYSDDMNFDFNVFTILLEAQANGNMAIDYYSGFGTRVVELFDDVIKIVLEHNLSSEVISNFYRVEAMVSKTLPKIATADICIKKEFWQYEFINLGCDADWSIKECKQYGTINSFLHLLYFTHHKNTISAEKLFNYLEGIENMELAQHGGNFDFYIKELLKPLQVEYIDDPLKCERIAMIEMVFFRCLDWENMPCLKKAFNQEPKLFADLISIIFKKDNVERINYSETENRRISNLYDLYDKAKFCPAECDGEVNQDELESWINQFVELLEKNQQKSLLGMMLGRLFAFSPIGVDGYMPCEAVRAMIEKYSSPSLQCEYSVTVYNSRGVFSPTAGDEEQRMAQKFQNNADYLSKNGYPRTAEIYYSLARNYFLDSSSAREDAENGRF